MATLVQSANDQRKEQRFVVDTENFKGVLKLSSTGKPLNGVPVDVSRSGLGLVMRDQILPEFEITLQMGEFSIRLELRWGMLDLAKNQYRYGFELAEVDQDLQSVFQQHGLI